jgi:hypothetical protein
MPSRGSKLHKSRIQTDQLKLATFVGRLLRREMQGCHTGRLGTAVRCCLRSGRTRGLRTRTTTGRAVAAITLRRRLRSAATRRAFAPATCLRAASRLAPAPIVSRYKCMAAGYSPLASLGGARESRERRTGAIRGISIIVYRRYLSNLPAGTHAGCTNYCCMHTSTGSTVRYRTLPVRNQYCMQYDFCTGHRII